MPFESDKQRKYMWAKHPDIAKKWEDENKFADGGIMTDDEIKKSRMKEGVPGYKARRFLNNMFSSNDNESPEPEKKEEKPEKFKLINALFKKNKK